MVFPLHRSWGPSSQLFFHISSVGSSFQVQTQMNMEALNEIFTQGPLLPASTQRFLFAALCYLNANIQGHPSPEVSLENVHIQAAMCLHICSDEPHCWGQRYTLLSFFSNPISVFIKIKKNNYCMQMCLTFVRMPEANHVVVMIN